jgi:hypothetical protein
LEERALADSDDSDRFAGTQADTLTSFVKTSGALTAMTAERDAARAALGRIRALCDSNIGVATRDGYLLVATIRKALEGKAPQ